MALLEIDIRVFPANFVFIQFSFLVQLQLRQRDVVSYYSGTLKILCDWKSEGRKIVLFSRQKSQQPTDRLEFLNDKNRRINMYAAWNYREMMMMMMVKDKRHKTTTIMFNITCMFLFSFVVRGKKSLVIFYSSRVDEQSDHRFMFASQNFEKLDDGQFQSRNYPKKNNIYSNSTHFNEQEG